MAVNEQRRERLGELRLELLSLFPAEALDKDLPPLARQPPKRNLVGQSGRVSGEHEGFLHHPDDNAEERPLRSGHPIDRAV